MIEWKAVIMAAVMFICYMLYKLKHSVAHSDSLTTTILPDTKLLIDELHRLTEQHTNLMQFLFDTEQEKDSRYSISYKTADNTTKTAEIIKAVDSTPYIQELTRQQIKAVESRINAIIKELNKPIPRLNESELKALYKVTQTEIKEEQRLPKGKSGGLISAFIKAVGEVLRKKDVTDD